MDSVNPIELMVADRHIHERIVHRSVSKVRRGAPGANLRSEYRISSLRIQSYILPGLYFTLFGVNGTDHMVQTHFPRGP